MKLVRAHKAFLLLCIVGFVFPLLFTSCRWFPRPTPTATRKPPVTSVPSTVTPLLPEPTAPPTPLPGREHGDSAAPAVSADGRWVAFASRSGDLVEEKLPICHDEQDAPTHCMQIFVYDRETGAIELISRSLQGKPGSADSRMPDISANGRWMVFSSRATELAPGSETGVKGVYLYDRQAKSMALLSPNTYRPSISADGRWVVYDRLDGFWEVWLYDREAGQARLVSQPLKRSAEGVGLGNSLMGEISADGNWVAFWSWAGLLAQEDESPDEPLCQSLGPNPACGDVYLYERETGRLSRVQVDLDWGDGMVFQPLSLSGDGRWLAYLNRVYDRQTGEVSPLCSAEMQCSTGALSGDGQWVLLAAGAEVFLQRLFTDEILRITDSGDGAGGGTESFENIDCGEGRCILDADFDLSGDGRWIVFSSTAGNLVPGDTQVCGGGSTLLHNCRDIFLYDRVTGEMDWISKPTVFPTRVLPADWHLPAAGWSARRQPHGPRP